MPVSQSLFRAHPLSPAQCPLPKHGALSQPLTPPPAHTAAGVGHEGKGPLPGTLQLLFPHSAQPLLLPALQPEQGTGTVQGVPRQDSGGCGGHQESQGKGRCEGVLQQEGMQLDSRVDCLEVKEWGHGRSSSHGPPYRIECRKSKIDSCGLRGIPSPGLPRVTSQVRAPSRVTRREGHSLLG